MCFGRDNYGQISSESVLADNLLDEGVKLISTGTDHACAINQYGVLICWGRNNMGQTDIPSND